MNPTPRVAHIIDNGRQLRFRSQAVINRHNYEIALQQRAQQRRAWRHFARTENQAPAVDPDNTWLACARIRSYYVGFDLATIHHLVDAGVAGGHHLQRCWRN
jgi:hypothetical protein